MTSEQDRILTDIIAERQRQDAKWGPQSHPNGTDADNTAWAEAVKDRVEEKADLGTVTWFDILDEEVAEASAEEDAERLRTELIQSAAVIVAWVEDIDRKSSKPAA